MLLQADQPIKSQSISVYQRYLQLVQVSPGVITGVSDSTQYTIIYKEMYQTSGTHIICSCHDMPVAEKLPILHSLTHSFYFVVADYNCTIVYLQN